MESSRDVKSSSDLPIVHVDMVSDVVCSWCYIGKRRLEEAIALVPKVSVNISFRPYFLNPWIPREGIDRTTYLETKFGSVERYGAIAERVVQAAGMEGLVYAPDKISRQPNTLDCHRLILWSRSATDPGAMKQRLMDLYFAEGGDLTDAKVLIQVTLFDVDAVQPRETIAVKIAATDVPAAYEKLRSTVTAAKGRIITARINEQDRRDITANLDITMNRADAKVLEAALAGAGETLKRSVTRAPDAANVTDAKVHAVIDLMPAAAIAPRETTTLAMEVSDVPAALTLLTAQVKEVQGRIVETQVGQERNGQVSARVLFDVPLSDAAALAEKFKNAGQVRVHQVTRDPQAPEGKLAIGRLVVTLSNTPLLVPSDQGLWSQVRGGLAFSLRGLSISASWLIVGLLFVLPWLLVLYAALWLARRLWRGDSVPATIPAGSAGNIPPASNP